MHTIKIRDLRGAALEALRGDELVGVTNNRVLVAVLIPASEHWVRHVLAQNQTRIEQNIAEGEQATKSSSVRSLASVLAERPAPAEPPGQARTAADVVMGYATAIVRDRFPRLPMANGDYLSYQTLGQVVERLRALIPGTATDGGGKQPERMRQVRIGDISGEAIQRAAEAGTTLVLTHDRMLIGLIFPLTPDLVQHLIEQNISRVLTNIAQGERQLGENGELYSLEKVTLGLSEEDAGRQLTER